MLHRYWIKFTGSPEDLWPCQMGCGVTAYDEEDALRLIQERIFQEKPLPPVQKIDTDIDLSTLDPSHILPNIGVPIRRGIWFPMGFDW